MVVLTGAAPALLEPSVTYLKIRAWSAPAVLISMVAQVSGTGPSEPAWQDMCCINCCLTGTIMQLCQVICSMSRARLFLIECWVLCPMQHHQQHYLDSSRIIDRSRRHVRIPCKFACDTWHHLLFAGRAFSPAGLLCAFHLGGGPVSSECGRGLGSDHVLQAGSGWSCLGHCCLPAGRYHWSGVDVQV